MGVFLFSLVFSALTTVAAPYAALVIDARSGKVLHSENADTRLHPASLTKMMTLYVVFEAVENGELSLDQSIKISSHAASEPPSKLGLRTGQQIKLRYLIRAAAVKSANDAATALGEAVSGSEAAFARRMNRTAKALGMSRTTFKNAHGLTESGHLSTARDMTTLGRHLFFDYPEYYNLFSRVQTDAGIKAVANTNRRFLNDYRGADGIKTGYTRAAGFNLVASAERGSERIIATVFGGRSTTTRNNKVAELLDLGFKRAPTRTAIRAPQRPAYQGQEAAPAAKTIRVTGVVSKTQRPTPRPQTVIARAVPQTTPEADAITLALKDDIESAMREAVETPIALRPFTETKQAVIIAAPATPSDRTAGITTIRPEPRIIEAKPVVVTRVTNDGAKSWGVSVGAYNSRYQAERVLLKTALAEMTTLDGTKRAVHKSSKGYEARFMEMNKETAEMACRRLSARESDCVVIAPS